MQASNGAAFTQEMHRQCPRPIKFKLFICKCDGVPQKQAITVVCLQDKATLSVVRFVSAFGEQILN